MQQSMHELLPEMAWQAGVLYELGRIVKLLQSIEASLSVKPEAIASARFAVPDDVDWESADVTDY